MNKKHLLFVAIAAALTLNACKNRQDNIAAKQKENMAQIFPRLDSVTISYIKPKDIGVAD